MQNFKEELKRQLAEIDELLARSKKDLAGLKSVPDRGIAVSKSNGFDQFFWVDKETRHRTYARADEFEMLKKVAQKEYESALIMKLNKLRKKLDVFIRKYDISQIDKVYGSLSHAKRQLVVPVRDTDEIFVKKWEAVEYDRMPTRDETEFYSDKGIRVRSKSELMIANMLEKMEIPYRYEYPITLKGLGAVRPDFVCLNIRKRMDVVWEHFGMLDNAAYANNNVRKIQAYQQNDWKIGKNLIMTFESSQYATGSNIIRNMIKEYLC